jgi:hypothetical protein
MGMSMGGLIARYKLAEMEKAAPGSTQTRLLILQDSPQRGANLPLGLSALLRQSLFYLGRFTTGDVDITLQEANALLDQPATKQLILYQTRTDGKGAVFFADNTFIEGSYRTMVNYQAPYRIVAVSQGSQCGTGLFAPYTEMIRGTGHLNIFNFPFVFAGSSGVFGEVIVNAIPANGQSNRLSGLNAVEQTSLFFGAYRIKVQLLRENYVCPPGLLPLDGGAGGTEPIGSAIGVSSGIASGNLTKGPFWLPFVGIYKLADNFCFIPTPSALDIADLNTTSIAGRYVNGVTSTSVSRTNGFLAQERLPLGTGTQFNQPHLKFTARNGEWIFDQMENKLVDAATVACTTECSTLSAISGPSQFCYPGTATFQVNSSDVTWTATPYSLFTTTTGTGSQFTTSLTPGAQGTATITATPRCGPAMTTSVIIGGGSPTGYFFSSNTGNVSSRLQTVQFVSPGNITLFLDQPYTFTFSSSSSSIVLGSTSGRSTSFYLPPNTGVTIRATAPTPDCGLSGQFTFSAGSNFTATPNPASTELTVVAADPTTGGPAENTADYDADLYDTYGKKVKTKRSDRGKAVLDVRELPDGLYNLRIGQGKDAYSEHIQVKH